MLSRKKLACACAALLLFIALLITPATARATDDENEYEETARVVRVSLLRGEVTLKRAGNVSWERARLNMPLVEGDTLTTGHEARLEIQFDARNFVRVGADSVLQVVTLRNEGVALSLAEGTATVRLARFERDQEYFEIDAPNTTVAAEKRGLYRLDVTRSDGGVRVTVRDGGQARIYSETSGFILRDKRTAQLISNGLEAGDWELSSASAFDEWDAWTDESERYLASRLRYEERDRYYDRDVWGAEELDAYGDWSHTKDYGWVWRPHLTVINHYSNWAPYRYGHWAWCPPYGWTWIGDEEWGWAPYHHGRWVQYNNSWCWAPRGYGYAYKRSWWRPALVAFVYIPTSYGEHVAWYPLQHGQRDPRSRWWRHTRGRLTSLRPHQLARHERTNPAYLRAVSSLPVREFGSATAGTRARPATAEVARRAFTGEPIRGQLPITPTEADRRITSDSNGRARLNITRPTQIAPARPLPNRPTGAATRAPGVSLDGELRRARLFGNRAPRVASSTIVNETTTPDARSTGAVARPTRPFRRLPVEPSGNNRAPEGVVTGSPVARPRRPAMRGEDRPSLEIQPGTETREQYPNGRAPDVDAERDGSESYSRPIERRARPVRPPRTDEDRPVAPPVYERREMIERRRRPSDPSDVPRDSPDQSTPSERRDAPSERRVFRRERPEPRGEPRSETEATPRQEQQREAPTYREAPRQSSPPSRSEPSTQTRPEPSAPPRSNEQPAERTAPSRPAQPSAKNERSAPKVNDN